MISQQQIPKGKTHTITSPTTKTKVTGAGNHWSLISLNINGLNSPIKRHRLTDWIQKKVHSSAAYKKHISTSKTGIASEKRVGEIFQSNGPRNKLM